MYYAGDFIRVNIRNFIFKATPSSSLIPVWIIRLSVGSIFLSEGIQKFLFSESVGAGRFAKIGLPMPEALGPFVGSVEIICGVLILAGFITRVATIPLIIVMITAICSTKIPILLNDGFWKMAHGSRTDFSMLLSLIFLIIVGSGHTSVDQTLGKKIH